MKSPEETIKKILGELAGSASVCWCKEGVFQSENAIKFVDLATDEIMKLFYSERSRYEDCEFNLKKWIGGYKRLETALREIGLCVTNGQMSQVAVIIKSLDKLGPSI